MFKDLNKEDKAWTIVVGIIFLAMLITVAFINFSFFCICLVYSVILACLLHVQLYPFPHNKAERLEYIKHPFAVKFRVRNTSISIVAKDFDGPIQIFAFDKYYNKQTQGWNELTFDGTKDWYRFHLMSGFDTAKVVDMNVNVHEERTITITVYPATTEFKRVERGF